MLSSFPALCLSAVRLASSSTDLQCSWPHFLSLRMRGAGILVRFLMERQQQLVSTVADFCTNYRTETAILQAVSMIQDSSDPCEQMVFPSDPPLTPPPVLKAYQINKACSSSNTKHELFKNLATRPTSFHFIQLPGPDSVSAR